MSVIDGIEISGDDGFAQVQPAWKRELEGDLRPSSYFQRKTAIDRVLAAILLIPGLPIIGLLVLLVRLSSRGPGIYRQTRVGKGGRTFTMYKIRTMTHGAEIKTGAVWTRVNDARITALGRLLRKLHLDEFPQLFNVLKGEMSLIGPRPERPEFVHVLAGQIPGYVKRLAVPPGITGVAQINLPPDTDLDSVRNKLVLDLEYIREANTFLDTRLLLCTLIRLIGLPGVYAMGICRLRREVTISGSHPPSTDEGASAPSAAHASVATEAVDFEPGANNEDPTRQASFPRKAR